MVEVSVCIPVYNVARYLQQCIDSLLHQTLKNIELVFVNDASTDDSLDILLKNQSLHPEKIKVIDSKVNRKLGSARNLGIANASGKYIGFVDSDDFVAPFMFETIFKEAERTSADAVFIQYTSVAEDTKYSTEIDWEELTPIILWDKRLTAMKGRILNDKDICDLIALPIGGVYCGLYRREMIMSSGVTFPEKLRYEDNYWLSLIKPCFRKVSFVDKVCYAYRYNPSSITHQRNQSFQIRDRIMIENKVLAASIENGYFDCFYDAFEWCYTFRYAVNTFLLGVFNFDKPDIAAIRRLEKQLRVKFPKWYKNPYFRSQCSIKKRIKFFAIIYFPGISAKVLQLKKTSGR